MHRLAKLIKLSTAAIFLSAVVPLAYAQDTAGCGELPASVPSQTSYTVSVPYVASTQRDVVVELWGDAWLATSKTTVNAGSGTASVTLNLPSAPANGSNYLWKASIRPVGASWMENLDLCQKSDITIGSPGGDGGGGGETGTGAWLESGGVVVMEAEHGEPTSSWVTRASDYGTDTSMAGSKGDGWLEWTGGFNGGNTITEANAKGIITYTFEISTPGDYIFRWRSKQYSNVPSGDAGNDTFVRFASGSTVSGYEDFSSFSKVWVQSKDSWSWNTTFEPHHGEHYGSGKARRNFTAGTHSIQISARSAGHSIDRMVLHRTSVNFNEVNFNNLPESDRSGGPLAFDAIDDFKGRSGGTANYYEDNTYDALAINPGNAGFDDSKFARAGMTFSEETGLYDVTITTITEKDGECTYRLLINNTVVRTFQNPRVGDSLDLKPHTHTWSGLTLVTGDTVAIESNSHSNDIHPEANGANNFAWARGRWRTLTLTGSSFTGEPLANAGSDEVAVLPNNSVTLNGAGTDEDGTISTFAWTQISGPNTANLSGQATADLTASNLIQGTYQFRLTVADNDNKTGTDDVYVSVIPEGGVPVQISGELKRWHNVTLTLDGPSTNENASPNPFYDRRFDVIFTHPESGLSYRVPGYFAADGNSANTSASSGNKWRAHLSPDEIGTWTYQVDFRQGSNSALGAPETGTPLAPYHGTNGSFVVTETDKSLPDFRARGRLQYVNKHHLRFKGDSSYFIKAGPDSPENMLAYDDFDNTPNTGSRRKSWQPHQQDYVSGDPTWAGGKGSELIGAVNYLANEGLNVMSFLTYSYNGDDKNVFPHRTAGNYTRMDCSKLDQWGVVLAHAQKKGIYLHFKTQETENDQNLDGGNLGNQRKLYYRELVARYGHHLALNWNLGEETTNTANQAKDFAQWFYDNDPYRHHVVIHTYPNEQDQRYNPLLGNASKLTGASVQTNKTKVFADTKRWREKSAATPRPWVVANDEQGPANEGIKADSNDSAHNAERGNVLWGNLMAGGAGIESYFGYQQPETDLSLQNFRSRANWWDQCRHALRFFYNNGVPFWNMSNADNLVSGSGNNANHCLALSGSQYVVYLRSGGNHTLNLSGVSGGFTVKWYNPRTGGSLINGASVVGGGTVSLGSPPNSTSSDWVALVSNGTGTGVNTRPFVSAGEDKSAELLDLSTEVLLDGSVFDDGLPVDSALTVNWTVIDGPAFVNITNSDSATTTATFTSLGSYVLRLSASDGTLAASDDVTITIQPKSNETSFQVVDDAFTQNGTNQNTVELKVENTNRKRITYLKFNLQSLQGAPASAMLKMVGGPDVSSGTMTIRVFAAASNGWTESAITGDNAPAKGAELASFTGDITTGQELEFDLTSGVSGAGTYSFILETDDPARDVSFVSSEGSSDSGPSMLVGLPNADPLFSSYHAAVSADGSLEVPYTEILANASDPDGDPVSLVEQSANTSNGGDVLMGSGTLIYNAPLGKLGTDTFTMTVSDGRGGSAEADLIVEIIATNAAISGSAPQMVGMPNGVPAITFDGAPYFVYTIERSSNLSSWEKIGSVKADATGHIDFQDPEPLSPHAFYRISAP